MKKLAELRKARGIKQGEMARLMDVSQGTISNWEHGRYEPKIAQLFELAEILECSVMELIEEKRPQRDAKGSDCGQTGSKEDPLHIENFIEWLKRNGGEYVKSSKLHRR